MGKKKFKGGGKQRDPWCSYNCFWGEGKGSKGFKRGIEKEKKKEKHTKKEQPKKKKNPTWNPLEIKPPKGALGRAKERKKRTSDRGKKNNSSKLRRTNADW